ncbi:hypothetical protein OIU85_000968 [Salix viminalis]|uniref:Uncharacterized protein n=1 Tax=Salix viminalis TaxID=40686 RepID=A0A9Q0ZXH4_SALVM|nr:hypothetical protein OIU85_000968 [Salix viminalis]
MGKLIMKEKEVRKRTRRREVDCSTISYPTWFLARVKKKVRKEQHEVFQARDGGGTTEDQAQKKQKVAVVDEESEKVRAEEDGGGGIIDRIISHFPTSLPDAAAPSTDEASILIHSIIHD